MFFTKYCFGKRPKRVTFYDHFETDIPVFSTALDQLEEGVGLKIFGFMPENSEKFAIHLILDNPTKDIALRINPRLPQNYIVRNSRIYSKWGKPETASTSPFILSRGKFFRIHILTTNIHYLIALNGVHFARYLHRIPYSEVKFLKIYGDVSNIHVTAAEMTSYPERRFNMKFKNLALMWLSLEQSDITCKKKFNRCSHITIPLPFYGLVSHKYLWNNKHLRFEGRVKLLPVSFTIQLQIGQNVWPHPIVPFHLSYKFLKHNNNLNKNIVVRKAWDKGKWIAEETSSLTSDLCPGRIFSLVIAPGANAYEVFVNRKFVFEFAYFSDYNLIDTVYVDGDIILWQIMIEIHNTEVYINPKKRRKTGFFF